MNNDKFTIYTDWIVQRFIEVKNYDRLGELKIHTDEVNKASFCIGKHVIGIKKTDDSQRFFEFGIIADNGVFIKQSLTVNYITIQYIEVYYAPWKTVNEYIGCNCKTQLEILETTNGTKKYLDINFEINENSVLRIICNVINNLNIVLYKRGYIEGIVIERLKDNPQIFGFNPVFNNLTYDYNFLLKLNITFYNCWVYKYRSDDSFWLEV
ncbi:MAG: hypothetical protein JWO03_2997 [Bacteroidetes bacterium]|nr:hypothetical protein [Bacteroidota bacterium]